MTPEPLKMLYGSFADPDLCPQLLTPHEVPGDCGCASGPNVEGRSCYFKDGRPNVTP